TYAAAHPLVVATQDSITSLSKDSPQTESLKREVKELEREVQGRESARVAIVAAHGAARAAGAAPARPEPLIEARREVGMPGSDDQSVEYLRAHLKMSIDKYQDLLGRIDGARIELDTARAAFKYRYSVVRPAQVPKKVERPKPAVVLGGGVFAAMVLALFLCVAMDLRAGRIVEAWQVEKLLGVPVLVEVKRA
ncbi:MAG: hypothetical protein HY901_26060, partial [Deltaproteobacteria bacterium]|nr:hypothetical protein [Deltaproteobacteria bacterium]